MLTHLAWVLHAYAPCVSTFSKWIQGTNAKECDVLRTEKIQCTILFCLVSSRASSCSTIPFFLALLFNPKTRKKQANELREGNIHNPGTNWNCSFALPTCTTLPKNHFSSMDALLLRPKTRKEENIHNSGRIWVCQFFLSICMMPLKNHFSRWVFLFFRRIVQVRL